MAGYKSHPWNLNFQSVGISEYIESDDDLALWDFAIPIGSAIDTYSLPVSRESILPLHAEQRIIAKDNTVSKMLRVNERHVRVGAGGCAKIGLPFDEIQKIRTEAGGKPTDKDYLIENRRPIALLHLMLNTGTELQGFPQYIYAIGLGFPGGKTERKANYVVNTTELMNYVDIDQINDEDDDNDIQGI